LTTFELDEEGTLTLLHDLSNIGDISWNIRLLFATKMAGERAGPDLSQADLLPS
jgi:hypothetical protein